ncbi:hypothetical protein SAMN04488072_109165 [Lentibacillus halodurans]|uniref:Uncharacterized protein n=1 Tax=Lentibacillus halodurans TaxID=237679 RepID=A0A1I0Z5Y0_9BACI|nr:hypothetical protein [Lentibacillus halodurans]SFB20516.1 hypothetical protein SAMN04488072_109165 [Lentibacillus halodurans]
MGNNYDYLYLDYQKQEVVNQLFNKLLHRKSHYKPVDKDADQVQSKWGLDILLLRLIQKGEVEKDPRSYDKLVDIWEEFCVDYPNIDFTLDEVIQNGWVRVVWDRWYLPQEFIYSRKKSSNNPLVIFMQLLSQVPYPDERKLKLNSVSKELDLHREHYPKLPELDWFLSEEIIFENENDLFLNCRHNFVAHYSSFLLAKLWEEEVVGPLNITERLTWWKNYFEVFGTGLSFFKYINNNSKSNFLDAAVERLLSEEDCIGWEEEMVKLSVEGLSRYPEKMTILPDLSYYYSPSSQKELDRMDWLTSIGSFDAGILMDRPRQMLDVIFSIVLRYDDGGKLRVKSLINNRKDRPYFYKMLSRDKYQSHIIPYLLLEDGASLIGMYALIHYEAENMGILSGSESKIREDKTKEIWDEGLSFLAYKLHKQTPKKATNFILELVEWFYREIRKPSIHSSKNHFRRKSQLNSILQLLLEMPRHSRTDDLFLEDLLPELIKKLNIIYNNSDCPLKEELWPFGLWLFEQAHKGHLEDKNNILNMFAEKIAGYYIQSFSNREPYDRWIEVIEKEVESEGWMFIADKIYVMEREHWGKFLFPTEFENLVDQDNEKYSKERRETIGKIRTHIRLLSYLSLHLKNEELLNVINPMLSRLLLHFQFDKPEDGKVDVFDSHYEYNPFIGNINSYLFEKVSLAINNFADNTRKDTLREFKDNQVNINRLSTLYNAMDRQKDKAFIIQSITPSLVDKSLESIGMLPDVQNMVREMLNTENEELARMAIDIMDRYAELVKKRNLIDWMEWEFGERLRANFILGNGEEILSAIIPENLENRKKTKDVRKFYQGLVLLNSKDGNKIAQSIKTFEGLISTQPENIGYKINLIAANVRLLEQYVKSSDTDTNEIHKHVKKISKLFEEYKSDISLDNNRSGAAILVENRLYMSILIKDQVDFWNVYSSLDEELKTNLKVGSYAVQVSLEQEDWEHANLLLQDLLHRHGNNDMLVELKKEIEEKESMTTVLAPTMALSPVDWKFVGSARVSIKGLTVYDQARAYFNQADAKVKDVLVAELFDACNKMKLMAPTLLKYVDNGEPKQGEEDHYNDILAILLNQSFKSLGWTASTQPRGGFTGNQANAKGGIGERDVVIYDGNNRELTIIEGLRLSYANKQDILSHFQKLFRYDAGDAHFYFLINWGFSDSPSTLWKKYKDIVLSWNDSSYSVKANGNILDLFPYLEEQQLPSFYTRHLSDMGNEIYVIHLYVDVKMTSKWKI